MGTSNKTIAKNTLIVYARLIITTIIGLLSSRFVLQALGSSDYGLYNVVGGFIMMFSFISAALSTTTRRFLNYEMGKEDGNVNRIFNICLVLHILISFLTLFILEFVGIWYIRNYLNVDTGKEADAMFVFQVSTFVACLGIINVPFQSLFQAKERFLPVAAIDILTQSLKLALVFCLIKYHGNALRLYAIGMSVITGLSLVIYHYLAYRNWSSIVKWNFIRAVKSYKELIVFNNYNILSVGALLIRNQGSNILINYFFGTLINAAYAIAFTVQNYVNMVVGSIDTASAPQITQDIGSKDYERAISLTSRTCRLCVLMMIILLLPLSTELEFVLHLWLGENMPDGTVLMCYFSFLLTVISATSGGVIQLINAIGILKWFTLLYVAFYVLALIISCLLFFNGYSPYIVFISFFFADLLSRASQLFLLKIYLSFNIISFVRKTYIRPFLVFVLSIVYLYGYSFYNIDSTYGKVIGIILSAILGIALTFFVGLEKNERSRIILFLKKKCMN